VCARVKFNILCFWIFTVLSFPSFEVRADPVVCVSPLISEVADLPLDESGYEQIEIPARVMRGFESLCAAVSDGYQILMPPPVAQAAYRNVRDFIVGRHELEAAQKIHLFLLFVKKIRKWSGGDWKLNGKDFRRDAAIFSAAGPQVIVFAADGRVFRADKEKFNERFDDPKQSLDYNFVMANGQNLFEEKR